MKTCLLVDDDIDDQEIFGVALEEAAPDVQLVTANDALSALQRFHADPFFVPDFIFLDLNMPRMNGKQCLEEIKKINRLQHVPVVIYSTSSSDRDIADTTMLGATAFIAKPASISALVERLKKFFVPA